MKRLFIFSLLVLSFAACKIETKKAPMPEDEKMKFMTDTLNFTTIKWVDSTAKDIGKIKKGTTAEITFPLVNTGSKPLVISSVQPGCGCTLAEKPEEPILPGKEGKIVARFNSETQGVGMHRKNIIVRANTNPTADHILEFKVEVTN